MAIDDEPLERCDKCGEIYELHKGNTTVCTRTEERNPPGNYTLTCKKRMSVHLYLCPTCSAAFLEWLDE